MDMPIGELLLREYTHQNYFNTQSNASEHDIPLIKSYVLFSDFQHHVSHIPRQLGAEKWQTHFHFNVGQLFRGSLVLLAIYNGIGHLLYLTMNKALRQQQLVHLKGSREHGDGGLT